MAAELGCDDELGDELEDGDAEFEEEELPEGVDDLLQPAMVKTTAIARHRAMRRVRMIGSCTVCGEIIQGYVEVEDILVRNRNSDNGWPIVEV